MKLVLPDPQKAAIPVLRDACAAVVAQRDEIIGHIPLELARSLYERAQLIEKYLAGKEGEAVAQKAARIFEAAIGAALGPAEQGRPANSKTSHASEVIDAIDKDDRRRFRLIAEHRDAWEHELENGPGLSRAKVLKLIQAVRENEVPTKRVHPRDSVKAKAFRRLLKAMHSAMDYFDSEMLTGEDVVSLANLAKRINSFVSPSRPGATK